MRGVKHVLCETALAALVVGCASLGGSGGNPSPFPTTPARSSVLNSAVKTPGLARSPSPIGTPCASPAASTLTTPPALTSPAAVTNSTLMTPSALTSLGATMTSYSTTPSALTAPGATTTCQGTVTPTIVLTPTITPTLGPPTATLTPAPDQATVAAAAAVDEALVAFAEAQAKGDAQAMLQTQRKLLDVSASAVTAANQDQSPYGQKLRMALDSVSGAAAGNYDQMQDAHKNLLTLGGATLSTQQETPVAVLPRPVAQSQASLPDLLQSLQRAVDAYNTAQNTGNQSDLLKAQRDLVTAASAANAATKNNRTPLGQQIQKAVTLVNDGLGGDSGKFRDAATALAAVDTSNQQATATVAQQATATVAQQATATAVQQATITAAQQATATATVATDQGHHAEFQPLQNDLDSKLQMLQSAQAGSDKDSVNRAVNDLKQSIQKASDALASDQSPAANRFRDALGHASEVAGGDMSKLQQTRSELKAAVGQ